MKKVGIPLTLAALMLVTVLGFASVAALAEAVEDIPYGEMETIDGRLGSGWDDAFKKSVRLGDYSAEIYIKQDGENICYAMVIKTLKQYPHNQQFRAFVFFDKGDGTQWSTGDDIIIVPATGSLVTTGIDYYYRRTYSFDLDTKAGGTENAKGCGRYDSSKRAYVFEICRKMNSGDHRDVNFGPCDTVMTKFGFDVIDQAGNYIDEGYTEPPEPIHPVPPPAAPPPTPTPPPTPAPTVPLLEYPFMYSVKFVCGIVDGLEDDPLVSGTYATAINVHNLADDSVTAVKKVALAFPPGRQEPGKVTDYYEFELGPDQALEIDCSDIREMVEIEYPRFIKGFVVILSKEELDVVAVYTAGDPVASIDVEYVQPSKAE